MLTLKGLPQTHNRAAFWKRLEYEVAGRLGQSAEWVRANVSRTELLDWMALWRIHAEEAREAAAVSKAKAEERRGRR